MKITKSKLMEIIKEELAIVLESSMYGPTRLPRSTGKRRSNVKRRQYNAQSAYEPPELSAIGRADDPGENPLARGPRYRTKMVDPFQRERRQAPLSPEEARAHEILKRAGFRGKRSGDERVNLAMTQGKGWELSEYGARSILDKAVDAGEISYDTARAVSFALEKELYGV